MLHPTRRTVGSLFAAALAVPVLAAPALLAPAARAEERSFLTPAELDLLALLPAPAPEGSPAQQAEMRLLLALQQNRDPARVALAVADAEETPRAMFGALLGDRFVPAGAPRAFALLDRLGDTEEVVTAPAKRGFARRRPHVANPEVKPVVPLSSSGAYPSGHTTRGMLTGIILAAMLPERRAEILARAEEYGQSRVVGGIHYPSDVEAGYRSGTAAAAVLLARADFQAELAAARAELRPALGLAP